MNTIQLIAIEYNKLIIEMQNTLICIRLELTSNKNVATFMNANEQ